MKKKLILLGVFAALMLTNTAFAATSSATIGVNDTYATGSIVQMNGTIAVSGKNNAVSTERLWVELYKDDSTFWSYDTRIDGALLPVNSTASYKSSVSSYNYYVWLDPDGPNHTGCSGNGSAVN
ncbi:hypothetical protein [Cohnella soli]|uniref:Uncharacterized protein n=1 Tax=Cohnella soli TaxID=425005 RepID=A0ABW0HNE8_9BACL